MTYINCHFTDNRAVFQGGVLYAERNSTFTLKHCDLNHNTVIYGGAICIESCTS